MNVSCCDLFSGGDPQYDKFIRKRDYSPLEKISLKKCFGDGQIRKQVSQQCIDRRNSTKRSRDEHGDKELALFRRKVQIEKELDEVSREMHELSSMVNEKTRKLKMVTDELGIYLAKKGN